MFFSRCSFSSGGIRRSATSTVVLQAPGEFLRFAGELAIDAARRPRVSQSGCVGRAGRVGQSGRASFDKFVVPVRGAQ